MLYTSQTIPLSKISLDDWQLIKITGADSATFLQGQLTTDLNKLTQSNYLFAAQCDPKGKVWSNMLLFKRDDAIYYIERKSVVEIQLKELKKFAVFSKVTIEIDTTLAMTGFVSKESAQFIPSFDENQNCITVNDITYLKMDIPVTRYIVIGKQSTIDALNWPENHLQLNSDQWSALDMQAGYPIIDLAASNQFLPQAFNLQHFDAISFDKGCYCGQEMVARAQYRGINKRGLFLLKGSSDVFPVIGDALEQKMGESWRETGCILAAIKIDEKTIWVQAILNNDLEADAEFKIKNSSASCLSII